MPDKLQTEAKQQTFLSLYEPVHTRFARFCQARAYDSCEAKDLISETVLRVYENFDKLNDQRAFLSFLFGTATNIIKGKARRKKFWSVFRLTEAAENYSDRQNPELSADVRLLYEALQKLPEEQREAIILFEVSGFCLKEVQQIQGAGLSAVKSRIVRGKRKLAQLLNDQETLRLLSAGVSEEEQFARTIDRAPIGIFF
jgi:RNA polymerase sigma-70 factor (ECF subfamily)